MLCRHRFVVVRKDQAPRPSFPAADFSPAFPVLIPKGWQAGQNGAAFPRGRAAFIAGARNGKGPAHHCTGPLP
jgi:hypothetical protein